MASCSWKTSYDVFLSFRGTDTRENFTSHLYAALCRKNIKTFIDDSLVRGEEISVTLLRAIEESKISVVIFSENYASSRWCLDELVKIMETIDGRKVLPVFYHVDPSHVRNQTGIFGQHFNKLKARFQDDIDRIHNWTCALRNAANLSGWDSTNFGRESELSEEVAECVMKILYPTSYTVCSELVGVESQIEHILFYLSIGSMDVGFVGIWGMGGIGKTTIAEVIYSQISSQFDHCCFFRNIREKSEKFELVHLRKMFFNELLGLENLNIEMIHVLPTFLKDLLRRTKVLVVLDDVNDPKQIEAFAGSNNDHWFGWGSRIMVTSRDKEVLNGMNEIYKVEELDEKDSLQLLSIKAFKQKIPPNEFLASSKRMANYAKGVPLAIQVLGSHLFKRSIEEWEIVLNKLKKFPDSNIQKILEISYNELDEMQKNIFLDIACFFKGYKKGWVEDILEDGCGFAFRWGIIGLIDKCLVSVVNCRLEMHDLIQEMGMDIARRNGTRFWNSHHIYSTLKANTGNEAIEGIFMDMSKINGKIQLNPKTFLRMPNLRLLKYYRPNYSSKDDAVLIVESNSLSNLPNNLSLLHWDQYPCSSLPSSFFMDSLVHLSLQSSNITQLWHGNKCPQKLKRLNLSKSIYLKSLPNLSSAINLERIDLKDCRSLVEIPLSIQSLQKLTFMDLNGCKHLRKVPSLVNLESLKNLGLRHCRNLKMLPNIPNDITWLEVEESGLKEWSPSVPSWKNITFLSMKDCKNLKTLPSLSHLDSLNTLDLSNCSNLKILPQIPGSIQELKLQESGLEAWSPLIRPLDNLEFLNMRFCRNLRSFPVLSQSKSLETIFLYGCSNLKILPEIPSSIKELELDECTGLEEWSPSIQLLNNLVRLTMQNCRNLTSLPNGIRLNYVYNCWAHDYWAWWLNLSGCRKLSKVPEITGNLQRLILDETAIQELPASILCNISSSMAELRLQKCENLEILPESICVLKCLEVLDVSGCSKLCKLPPLNGFCSLIELHMNKCKKIKELPQLPGRVRQIQAMNCSLLQTAVSTPCLLPMRFNEESLHLRCNYTINFCNCRNLDQIARRNIMEDSQNRIQQISNLNEVVPLIIAIPGSEIPEWFGYQSWGNSITIQQACWSNTMIQGFAFSVVVEPKSGVLFGGHYMPSISCSCRFRNVTGGDEIGVFHCQMDLEGVVESDHVFVWNSDNTSYNHDWFMKNFGNNNVLAASFDAVKFKVKRCGLRLIFSGDQQPAESDRKDSHFEQA